tara:strand:+ start:71841 stop:72269 length:429 start_codon:yes stop_codon:yes gene_type:complete
MILNEEMIRLKIQDTNSYWNKISEIVFNQDLNGLIKETEKQGRGFGEEGQTYEAQLQKLNKLYLDINKCVLDLQNPDKLRIETIEDGEYIEVKIYILGDFHDKRNYNKTDYPQQIYSHLISYYEYPSYDEMIEYKNKLDGIE